MNTIGIYALQVLQLLQLHSHRNHLPVQQEDVCLLTVIQVKRILNPTAWGLTDAMTPALLKSVYFKSGGDNPTLVPIGPVLPILL